MATRRTFLATLATGAPLGSACGAPPSGTAQPPREIGFTQLRTNLPGGRHANTRTMRAMLSRLDGTAPRPVGEDLVTGPDHWTQFAGWSPDGRKAIILQGWQNPANAIWEEEHKTFRFQADSRLLDCWLVDLETGKRESPTANARVSFYNSGLFFWPNEPGKLGFTALIGGESRPFQMDLNGGNKRDLSAGKNGFTYGFSGSPDGKRIAYHKDYQVYVADADGHNPVQVKTGNPFNFGPAWSSDSRWVLFVSGEHHRCHPHLARADGSGVRKLADRGGYRGVTQFLDVFDFHDGSSDTPCWAADGQTVFYTAQVGDSVELHRARPDGSIERLTRSAPGTWHYHPTPLPTGGWLAYGSMRWGIRQIIARELETGGEIQVTHLAKGQGAMWPHWRPGL